jgi:hypothetical protein
VSSHLRREALHVGCCMDSACIVPSTEGQRVAKSWLTESERVAIVYDVWSISTIGVMIVATHASGK